MTDVSALAGLDSLKNVDLTGNPLSGSAVEAQVPALRERGVTVDMTEPEEPEDPGGGGVVLGDLPIVFVSSRRTGEDWDLEVHSLDPGTGVAVNLSEELAEAPLSGDDSSGQPPPRHGVEPAQSPDGRRIAFTSYRDYGNYEIYAMDADGGRPENLTIHPAYDVNPAWSPDGGRIAFISDRNGEVEVRPWRNNTDIYVMDAAGSGVEQVTSDPLSRSAEHPAWSPDGSSIAFNKFGEEGSGIFVAGSVQPRGPAPDGRGRAGVGAFVVPGRPLDRLRGDRGVRGEPRVEDPRQRRRGPPADRGAVLPARPAQVVSRRRPHRPGPGGPGRRGRLRPLRHLRGGGRRRAAHRRSGRRQGPVLGALLMKAAGPSARSLILCALALAGCGSEPDPPIGPGPDPGDANGVALVFADSALQAAVEEAAVAAESGDAAGLVSLTAKDRGIADLGGIEQLTRLEALDLYGNEIRDLSPLSGLRRLRYLDLGSNRVEEVSALESLKSLQVLLLADNGVTEISALAGLDSLQSVDLTGNPLEEAARGPGRRLPRARRDRGADRAGAGAGQRRGGPARGTTRGARIRSARLAVAVLLQPAHQGFLPLRPRGPLPGPGDGGGGQPVLGPDRLPLVRRHRARLPHRLPPAQQRGAGPVAGRDPGGLHLAPGQGPGDLRPGRRRRRPGQPDAPPGE